MFDHGSHTARRDGLARVQQRSAGIALLRGGGGKTLVLDAGQHARHEPVHLAFRAPSREAVDRFHATGLRCGAKNNGDPGVRRGRYYCAFLIDFDGNNIEAGVYA
jgi:predicted lactoylglutathione lyase